MSTHDFIFYENRRTPEVVPHGTPGKKGGVGTAAGKVIKRRAATEIEEKLIAKGAWIRVNVNGTKPSDPKYKEESKSKIRPHFN